MSKWTPGPWELRVDGICVSQCLTGNIICNIVEERMPHKANARLIAEAPAMAECLKKCERLAWEIGCYTDDDLWREISGILERINK